MKNDKQNHPVSAMTYNDILLCRTPDAWVQEAIKPDNLEILLIDHLNNEFKAAASAMSLMRKYGKPADSKNDTLREKKAAATALNLMFRYTEHIELLNKMSRLAREELRHFEQVLTLMNKRGIVYRPINASRYAGLMRASVRTHEPERMIDTLVVGAFIEARSCERFEALAPYLDDDLGKFYLSLLKSEARHFQDYLKLAMDAAGYDLADRVRVFAEVDRDAMESEDKEFHFHSGVPARVVSTTP